MPSNLDAFISMLIWSELGTEIVAGSDGGYNVLAGSTPHDIMTFDSYADHPRRSIAIHHKGTIIYSTAAGALQIRAPIFDSYKASLGLPDFGPESQRCIGRQLIRECHALQTIAAGDIVTGIGQCSSRWASLPGNKAGQRQNSMDDLVNAYKSAGGTVAV